MATSKIERLKDNLKNLRKKSKEAKGESIRRVGNFGASTMIGYFEGNGLEKVPAIPGTAPEATIAAVGLVGAMFLPGTLGDVAEGIADSGIALTGRKLGVAAREAMGPSSPTPVRGEEVGRATALPPAPAALPPHREAIEGEDYDGDDEVEGEDPYEAFLDGRVAA